MAGAAFKRAASTALRAARALPIPWSRGRTRSRRVINERNTIAFFIILFIVAVALGFATYAMASGV